MNNRLLPLDLTAPLSFTKLKMVVIGKERDSTSKMYSYLFNCYNRRYAGSLDTGRKKISQASSVLARFKTMDSRGEAENDTSLNTVHQNTIK